MPPTPEKRRHPRRRMDLPLRSRPSGDAEVAKDISAGGLFLATRRLRTIGETLEVEIPTRPDTQAGGTIKATVQVTRITPEGVGAYFTQLDGDSAILLNLLLAR